jgi:hypothetical protein
MDIRVDSCSELATIADASVDIVVCNYVLMDAPDPTHVGRLQLAKILNGLECRGSAAVRPGRRQRTPAG